MADYTEQNSTAGALSYQYRPHTCENRTREHKSHLTEAGSTTKTKLVPTRNPVVLPRQEGLEQTQCHQQ